jgi:hypothetical protein
MSVREGRGWSLRLVMGTLAFLLAALAGTGARSAPAGAPGDEIPGRVLTPGQAPTTESWAQMLQRDLQLRAAAARDRLPEPRALPRFPAPQDRSQPIDDGIRAAGVVGAAGSPPVVASFDTVKLSEERDVLGIGGFIPPDTMGAIGPNHFVVMVNGAVAVYNRSGTRVSMIRDTTFFNVAGAGRPQNGGTDPRVIYDRRSSRWIACEIDLGSPAGVSNNVIVLAVSRSSDPTGTWDKYALPIQSGTAFADYESLGTDDNGIYFGMEMFTTSDNAFARIVATPKAPLLAASPSLGTTFVFDNLTDIVNPQAAHRLDAAGPSDPAWFVSSSTVRFSDVLFRRLTWSGGQPTLSSTVTVSTSSYGPPINAPASGSTTPLDVGDDRVMMAVVRNNRLWTCRVVGVNSQGTSSGADRTGCEWFELNVSTNFPSVVQTGRVFDPAASNPRFFFFPSIMVSGQGHAAMGFSGSAANEFVGAYTCGRLASDAPGTMGVVSRYRDGQSSYTRNDGIGRNRWGDYSYSSLDPNDDMTLWTIQEFVSTTTASTTSNWATAVARLAAPAPTLQNPNATVTAGQNNATISLTGTGFYDPGAGFASRPSVTLSGNGISNVNLVVNSATSATVTFAVAANASAGQRDITFTNPDGQAVKVVGGFTVSGGVASTIAFSQSDYSATEGQGPATITVVRDGGTTGTATVHLTSSNGTAGSQDFTAVNTTVSFGAGEATKNVSVQITDDNLAETSETVNLTLSNAAGATLASPSTATLTIQDNEAPQPTTLSFASGTFAALEASGAATVTVTRSGGTTGISTATVSVTAGGTAGAGDFTLASGAVSFGAGETSKNVTLTLVDDSLIEGPETVNLALTVNSGGTAAAPTTAVLTIGDDTAKTVPGSLAANALSGHTVQLTWEDRSTNETSFEVLRRFTGGSLLSIGTVPANTTAALDLGIPATTTVFYVVRAITASAASGDSAEASATTALAGKLTIKPPSLAFGTTRRLKPKSLTFTLTNKGPGLVTVLFGTPTGPFTTSVAGQSKTVKKKLKVTVTFQPTASGAAAGELPIQSDDPAFGTNGRLVVALTGSASKK